MIFYFLTSFFNFFNEFYVVDESPSYGIFCSEVALVFQSLQIFKFLVFIVT